MEEILRSSNSAKAHSTCQSDKHNYIELERGKNVQAEKHSYISEVSERMERCVKDMTIWKLLSFQVTWTFSFYYQGKSSMKFDNLINSLVK